MSGRLAGKVAIVTGAGSRGPGVGNGKAAAVLFAREGARVLCVDREPDRAEATVALITAEGGEASVCVADVTGAEDCRRMVGTALERYGGLDILHNNVGMESRKGLFEVGDDEWDRVMVVDLKSMMLATRAAAGPMIERGRGAVILRVLAGRLPGPWAHGLCRRQGRRHRLPQPSGLNSTRKSPPPSSNLSPLDRNLFFMVNPF